MNTEPKHGESRGHHFVTASGAVVHVRDVRCVESVCERYCSACKAWVETRGIVGVFQFMAMHDDAGHRSKVAPSEASLPA